MTGVPHSSYRSAPSPISLILLAVPALIGLADWLLAERDGVAVAGFAYARLAGLGGLFWLAGWLYEEHRPEPRLAAMLSCTSFLIGFTAAASVLNALLLTVAGPRIDDVLAGWDRALGFNWPAMMQQMARHPGLLWILECAYGALLPEIALAILILGTFGEIASVYRFVLAVALGALVCIFIWTLFPAFGAMSVYSLDSAVAVKLHVPVDGAYGEVLVQMLASGPRFITPDNVKGLIGFPSYHAVLAFLLIWYFRSLPWLRWSVFALNGIVILATPIEGGHHWIDVFAALPVAILAITGAGKLHRLAVQVNVRRLPTSKGRMEPVI